VKVAASSHLRSQASVGARAYGPVIVDRSTLRIFSKTLPVPAVGAILGFTSTMTFWDRRICRRNLWK
jgi:hypothetical protein